MNSQKKYVGGITYFYVALYTRNADLISKGAIRSNGCPLFYIRLGHD